MNLKPLFILLLICTVALGQKQDVKQAIANEFTEYQQAIMAKDFEKVISYMVPEFFDIYPKTDYLKLMEQFYNNPDIEFEISNLKIENIDTPEKIENKYYSLLTYSNEMNMKFLNQDELSEEDRKSLIGLTLISLEQSFGSNNVSYDPSSEFFRITAEKQVYAISGNGKSDWKFLGIEKDQKAVLEKLLPAELTRKF